MPLRLLLIALLALTRVAVAEPLTLAEAEQLWLANSRELRLAAIAVDAAQADLLTAGQRANPDFSVNVSSISSSGAIGNGSWQDKKMDSVFRLDQLIERGDKRELRLRGAAARLGATQLDAEAFNAQQRMQLRHAYYDLRLAQERLQLAGESAALMRRTLEITRIRLKAGDVAAIDVSRLAIDQARAEAEQRQAQADLESAQQALAYLIGRDDRATELLARDDWPTPHPLPDLPTWSDERPALRAAQRRVEAAEAERDLARARRSRDVTVGVQYERNPQGVPINSYGFGISVPLLLWHAHEGEIARAEAEVDASKGAYAQQRAQLFGQWAQARRALAAAQGRLDRLGGSMLEDAGRVAQAAEVAYSKGARGLLDLLDARRTLRQLQVEVATARADYAKARSDWEILASQGNMP